MSWWERQGRNVVQVHRWCRTVRAGVHRRRGIVQREFQTCPARVGVASGPHESDALAIQTCALNSVHHLTEEDAMGKDGDVLLFGGGRGGREDVGGDEMAKDCRRAAANVVEGFRLGGELKGTVFVRTGECTGFPGLSGGVKGMLVQVSG